MHSFSVYKFLLFSSLTSLSSYKKRTFHFFTHNADTCLSVCLSNLFVDIAIHPHDGVNGWQLDLREKKTFTAFRIRTGINLRTFLYRKFLCQLNSGLIFFSRSWLSEKSFSLTHIPKKLAKTNSLFYWTKMERNYIWLKRFVILFIKEFLW